MDKTDSLPKFICSKCFNKINTFHEFYCGVHIAQENFLRSLVKNEHSSESADHFTNSYEATNFDHGKVHEVQNDMDCSSIIAVPISSEELQSFPMEYDLKEVEYEQIERIKEESIEIDDDIAGLALNFHDF